MKCQIYVQERLNNIFLEKYIPARDPKQCVIGIVKGKVERTQNHKWLQASRARASSESMVFIQGGLWNKRCQVRFCKFPCEDLCRRSCARSP